MGRARSALFNQSRVTLLATAAPRGGGQSRVTAVSAARIGTDRTRGRRGVTQLQGGARRSAGAIAAAAAWSGMAVLYRQIPCWPGNSADQFKTERGTIAVYFTDLPTVKLNY